MNNIADERSVTRPVNALPLPSDQPSSSTVLRDRAWVTAIRTGDALAFEAMFRTYGNELVSFADSLLGSREAAQEVVQDLFLRIASARLSLESRPWSGLTTAGWVAFPATSPIFAQAGDRLPNSSRWSGNVSADQDVRVSAGTTASIGGALSYVGDRAGGYKADSQSRQPDLPAYAKADLRARLAFSAWTINAFVNNLTNKRGVMSGDPLALHSIRVHSTAHRGVRLRQTVLT